MKKEGLVSLELPFPPSVNTYYAVVRGRKILSKKGREYKKSVALAAQLHGIKGKNMEGRLAVRIDLYPPDRRRRDVDNYTKAILDGITKAEAWGDDEQVDHLVVHRCEKVKGGLAVVTITQIGENHV